MFLDLTRELGRRAADAAESAFGIRPANLTPALTPKFALGDLAFAFPFEIAKKLGSDLKPRDVAERLRPALEGAPLVRKVEVAGQGYLNVFLDRAAFLRQLFAEVRDGGPLGRARTPLKVLIEHTNINPNKAAHVGHVRNAVLGDTLARALRALGHQVEVQNYIDDTGVQVADVVVGFQDIEGKDLQAVRAIPDTDQQPFDHYCWDLYAKVGAWYGQDPAREARRHEVLKLIEEGTSETARIAQHVAETVVRRHLATARKLGIRYDLLAWEGDILALGLWAKTFEKLKATPAVALATEGKNAGCWVMRLEGSKGFEGLEDADKVLVRSNGTATYVAKDIAYQMWKFGVSAVDFRYARYAKEADGHDLWTTTAEAGETPPHKFGHAARVYNVIDVRQSYLQDVVAAGLQALGYEAESRNSVHYDYQMVALTPRCALDLGFVLTDEERKKPQVEMSGRRGLGVKADDLLERTLKLARDAVVQNQPELAAEEADAIAAAIAVGAIRYFMLRFGRNKVVAFDFQEALKFQGETGPYLQNSVVRCRSIFRKLAEREGLSEASIRALDPAADLADLAETDSEDEAWDVVFALARIDDAIESAVATLELSVLSRWAFQTAQRFHKFYERYRILGEPLEARRRERAAIVLLYFERMRRALELMGIPVPERM